MTGPVLVTGASGFLGRAIATELADAGYDVHGFCRATSDRSVLEGRSVTWHEGDLTAPDSVDAAVAALGPSAWLVHNAAMISYRTADADLQRAVNLEGTRAVLAAARRHRAARVLHVSSVVAVGYAEGDEELDEHAEWNAEQLAVDYVTTKRAAERAVLALSDVLDVRVVNPGAIFGPVGPDSNTSRFVRSLARGELGPFAPPGGMGVVGVADTARGVRLALERGERGRRYVLVERYMPHLELFRMAATLLSELGVSAKAPRWVVPRGVWPLVVGGARLVERMRGPLELATPQALTMLGSRWRLSGARARRELEWRPGPFEEVLADAIRHLHATGRLT